jgi:ADP-ribose pyrophosphatase YjhB (NUDIX family)
MLWQPPTPFEWNYCGTCGAPLAPGHDGERERPYCAACNRFYYRNPVPACCVFVRDPAGALLFALRAMEPGRGRWCLPGGFMEANETAEQCALRELREETALHAASARLLGASMGQSPLSGSVVVLGFVIDAWEGQPYPDSDAADLGFFARDARPDIAFQAHRDLLALYDREHP